MSAAKHIFGREKMSSALFASCSNLFQTQFLADDTFNRSETNKITGGEFQLA